MVEGHVIAAATAPFTFHLDVEVPLGLLSIILTHLLYWYTYNVYRVFKSVKIKLLVRLMDPGRHLSFPHYPRCIRYLAYDLWYSEQVVFRTSKDTNNALVHHVLSSRNDVAHAFCIFKSKTV